MKKKNMTENKVRVGERGRRRDIRMEDQDEEEEEDKK
jgi:hypothetical protein